MSPIVSKFALSSMSVHNLWTTDKGTFSTVIILGIASLKAATNVTRFITTHPNVYLDKTKRENTMHYSDKAGANWRARRFKFANLVRNPINQSRQYDDLSAKEENKSVRR